MRKLSTWLVSPATQATMVGIARLHGARGPAQGHDAAGAAERQMIEKTRAQAEMLGQADGGVGEQVKEETRKAVDVVGAVGPHRSAPAGARPIHQCAPCSME